MAFFLFSSLFFFFFFFEEEARPQVETEGMPLPQPPGSAYQKRRILEKKIENVRKSLSY